MFLGILDFKFFKHPEYFDGPEEDLILWAELYSPESLLFVYWKCQRNIQNFRHFSVRWCNISQNCFNRDGWTVCWCSINPYYQAISKKETTLKIDIDNLSVRSLTISLFPNENEEFYNTTFKKV